MHMRDKRREELTEQNILLKQENQRLKSKLLELEKRPKRKNKNSTCAIKRDQIAS